MFEKYIFLQRVQLLITVVDYDRVGASEPIGKVLLGCDQKGPELRHWSEMLASPRRPVAQWHTLKEIESKSICLKYVPMSAKVLDSCFASLARQFIRLAIYSTDLARLALHCQNLMRLNQVVDLKLSKINQFHIRL